MSTTTKTPYDTDFVAWAEETAALVRAGRLDEVDLEHVAEELEGLSGAQRKSVLSQLHRMIKHLIKQKIQPERDGTSWRVSIRSARNEMLYDVKTSPSLLRYLRENLDLVYPQALEDALDETGMPNAAVSPSCPWTIDDLLHGDLNELVQR
jgi:Domain of unknown function DUF29